MSFNNTNTDILLAGAFAALSIDLLVYPLDTIKTRFQSPAYQKLFSNQATGTANRALFRGLYQGIGSVVLATVPSSGAFFTTYEGTKALLHELNASLSPSGAPFVPAPFINSLASCAGELVSCLILTPAEVLKQNAHVIAKPAGARAAAFDRTATRQAFRKFKKPSQLWRGYSALAARNLPFTAMQFPVFEHLKSTILERRRARGVSSGTLLERAAVTALSAGSAGSLAALVTTPVDVVKTRIMLGATTTAGDDSHSSSSSSSSSNRSSKGQPPGAEPDATRLAARQGRAGSLAVGREILRSEGVAGLFRGASLRSAWTALGSGLYLAVYETGRAHLENRRGARR